MKIKVPKSVAHLVYREPYQFKIDTFCTGGPGGQNQNRKKKGIRITDLVTGLSAEGREFRSADQNRSVAFEKLVIKIVDFYLNQVKVDAPKNEKVIRTYNWDRNEVIDHETKLHYPLKSVLNGDLEDLTYDRLLYHSKLDDPE